ncbi:biotin-dependent carboxyltransferase family protein [Pedobacter gandavensis]|uniref:5-oxoprolinase subunit C family protein n=1 Tax=Pedobacter gandavensis TaxID=2679963 RepID=UPI0024793319|nr:biotin-dependent carboxyltransferase family protein [Pedobacter gandavensis]WGQ11656.1 biotin-dependent carboxyltransferase family protein [Pedobacter gandavensis]
MGIKVIKAGMLTTIQDLGRIGYRKDGVIESGAMDKDALLMGNLLLGNEETEAGLECTLSGPTLLFENEALIAITGADLSAEIDGAAVEMWRPILVAKGAVLSFGEALAGCRAYLTVQGGFDIPQVLGSYSTYLRAGFGGFEGRALKKGDQIAFKQDIPVLPERLNWSLSRGMYASLNPEVIRVIKGPEFDLFQEKSIADLFIKAFTISNAADRMGYQLEGPLLQLKTNKEMLSSAVAFGTVQVTAEGSPVVLMADHQTTGGYPRILQVLSVDLGKSAQLRSGQVIQFEMLTLRQAQKLSTARTEEINQLKQSLTFKYKNHG